MPPKKRPALTTDGVRQYLTEIGRIPLLLPEEEIDLAQQIAPMVRLQKIREELGEQLEREPLPEEWALAAEIEQSQLLKTIGRGLAAKKKMVRANLRLVVMIAKKYQGRGLEFMDLIQEGSMGLQRSAEKFNSEKGYKFSTYAYWWIRQAITRAIAEKARTVRNPIHITEKINKIKKAARTLSNKLGRTARIQDIGEELGMTTEEVAQLLSYARKPVSLSAPIGVDRDTELIEIIADENASPEFPSEATEVIVSLLGGLSAREKEVIKLRYLAEGGEPTSLAEIGRMMNLSRERIRQIEYSGLRKLKATVAKRRMKLTDVI